MCEALKERGLLDSFILGGDRPDLQPLLPFLARFWDYDQSDYIRERRNLNHKIGRRHCEDQLTRLRHWREWWKESDRLCDVSLARLRECRGWLRDTQSLAAKTTNAVISAGAVIDEDNGFTEQNAAA